MGYRNYQLNKGLVARDLPPDITWKEFDKEHEFFGVIYYNKEVPQLAYFYTVDYNKPESAIVEITTLIGEGYEYVTDYRSLGHFAIDIVRKT